MNADGIGESEFALMTHMDVKKSDRRSFLRGSGLFAAALGLSVLPGLASAGQQDPQKPKPAPKPEGEEEETPADPLTGEKSKDGKLYDKEGREYKVCPQCGYNMYKQGRMWICENCGYSYVE
jgi:hypothetical protein